MKVFFLPLLLVVLGVAFADDDHGLASLTLNNGQKWEANEATHVGVTNIQKLVMDADKYPDGELVSKMEKEIQDIITKCSMEGPAHDELHKVLHPIIEKVNALKGATGTDKQAGLDALKHLAKTYFEYFQFTR